MSKTVELDVSCSVDGRTWNLYSFQYRTQDGLFSGHLYAVSFEHASYVLAELKETAELDGQILEADRI
ncbi:hypothetical protein [Marinobacter salarius]|uniref:Uncharacterized protein n=1 Tax=Marinobacter salarius TaxID=1420917 RepID=A0A1W6K945_9GAMM|nr:hypothetical protein [Marinobacter salarius]ARM83931.1 hypothetical protein MARSALSMR5_01853 [Marinobacter salarius]